MEAIILAGGLGTRLKSVVKELPKPMAPIGDIPFLEIILIYLQKKGFKKIIISTFYKSEIISNYFGRRYIDMEIVYTKEKKALGTGGAIKYAQNFVSKSIDHFYVFNGDTFLDIDIDLLEKKWLQDKKPLIVGVEVKSGDRYGSLSIKNNQVIEFNEKKLASSSVINAGCYLFPKNFFDYWKSSQSFSLENDFFKHNLLEKNLLFFLHKGIFIDIGIPSDYEKAKFLLKKFYV